MDLMTRIRRRIAPWHPNRNTRLISNIEFSRFKRLVTKEDLPGWFEFLEEEVGRGTDRVVLGLDVGGWVMWVLYRVGANEDGMWTSMDSVAVAGEEEKGSGAGR